MPPTTEESPSGAPTASQAWLVAQKIRRSINQEIDHAKKCVDEGSEITHLKKLDELFAYYRLKCVEAHWNDIDYSATEKIDTALWTAHIHLNSAYRRVKDKYEKSQQAVTKRKIERLYADFLTTTQGFYKGFLQRLCARYGKLPELQRLITAGIVEPLEGVTDKDRVDAVATGVEKQVLASCYLTLIYLGDLWRYRSQLKYAQPERRTYRPALAYYSLANDLDPRSGYAYHQMGIVSLDQQKHFDIIYYFYRSLAAEQPHPTAAKNLEVELKKVLQPSGPSQGQDVHQALQDWFVRLHGYFHRGKEFPQHGELEDEVLHRLGVAVKAQDFEDGLLKLVLINICAYQVGKDRITEKWTAEGSQSCQFTLRLNIRTLCAILHQLAPELSAMVEQMRSPATGSNGGNETGGKQAPGKFSLIVATALPVLRIYMTWLCMYRSDIVEFESYLQPYVVDMYKSLSTALSSLCEALLHYPGLKTVPYLFREDMEVQGLKALNGPAVPVKCRLGINSITHEPKPRPEEAGNAQFSPDDLAVTRALDITTCAVVLADDPVFPLDISQSSEPPYLAKFTYQVGAQQRSAPGDTTATTTYSSPGTAAADLAAVLGVRPSPAVAAAEHARRISVVNAPVPSVQVNGFTEAPVLSTSYVPSAYVVAPPIAAKTDYAVDHDSRMNELVNGLVEPWELDPSVAAPTREETSYGMHTDTARDVFASAASSASPSLATGQSGPPGLPRTWGAVGQPTSQYQGVSSGSPHRAWPAGPAVPSHGSNRSVTGGAPAYGLSHNEKPLSGASTLYTNGQRTVTEPTTSSAWQHSRERSLGSQAIAASTGIPKDTFYGVVATGFSYPWNSGSSKFNSIQDILGAQLSALAPGPRPMASTPGPVSPAIPSSFASTNFSGNTSSLPPVNSPWGVSNNASVAGATPQPISRPTPPGFLTRSRPTSTGGGLAGFSHVRQESNSLQRGGAIRQPTTPGQGSGFAVGTGTGGMNTDNGAVPPPQPQQRAEKQDDADFAALMRRLQQPKS